MKQRVAIARALVVEPAIFLMDEPLSALDAQTRELLLDDLLGLWRERRFAAVYVTHNLAEATRLGHRVVVLSRRPGAVRETVTIATPHEARREGHPGIVAANARLWSLIRGEAAAADRELLDG
jgi:NitT/TauT family transport system ATP-binding protein